MVLDQSGVNIPAQELHRLHRSIYAKLFAAFGRFAALPRVEQPVVAAWVRQTNTDIHPQILVGILHEEVHDLVLPVWTNPNDRDPTDAIEHGAARCLLLLLALASEERFDLMEATAREFVDVQRRGWEDAPSEWRRLRSSDEREHDATNDDPGGGADGGDDGDSDGTGRPGAG